MVLAQRKFWLRFTTHRLYVHCIQTAAAFHFDDSTNQTHYIAFNLPQMKKHLCYVLLFYVLLDNIGC